MKNTRTGKLSYLRRGISGFSMAVISVVMMIVCSGCAGGRVGIRHHYDGPYGDGVVYYEGYDGFNAHHDNGWHGHKPKKIKYKKHKKYKHHHDD